MHVVLVPCCNMSSDWQKVLVDALVPAEVAVEVCKILRVAAHLPICLSHRIGIGQIHKVLGHEIELWSVKEMKRGRSAPGSRCCSGLLGRLGWIKTKEQVEQK